MFEYLQQIDDDVYSRYLTLEKNIKAASNSFYDSFLDLQEHFLKTIIGKNSITVAPHESCGALLKRNDVKDLFLKKYGLDSYAYDKMGDYAKKANEHKHRKEKNIEVDTIINYMQLFYVVSACCAIAEDLSVPRFDGKYFKDIYGTMDKTDERLNGLEKGQREILGALTKLASENKGGQAEEIKRRNAKWNLKQFIANAEKQYEWLGTKEEFKKDKTIHVCIQVALIIVGLLCTAISSLCLNLYSTFTFFENIVLFQMIFLLTYTLKAKKPFSDCSLAKYSSKIFELDGDNIWRDTHVEKKRYKWFRRISYVAVIANIICIWTMGSGAIRIFATIFELAFLGLTIASVFTRINFYCLYSVIFISGLNDSGTEKVTLVYDETQNKLYTLKDYPFKDFI